MAIKSARTKAETGSGVSAPTPTGKTAPTEPVKKVDPAVEEALELVEPAPGYALARLLPSEERHTELGLPADTVALLDAAMLRLVALHSGDDRFGRDYPVGTIVFASLEGIAPLLSTHLFLLPLDRVQDSLPSGPVETGGPIGFGTHS